MHSVYALCDPRTGDVRYVGQATDVYKRYAFHLLYSPDGPRKAWLEELKQIGRLPVLVVLESNISGEQIFEREKYWILYYHGCGFDLTNIAVLKNPKKNTREQSEETFVLEEVKWVDPTLISINEAGKLLGVSGKTVIRMMEDKSFDGYKIGSYWKFRRGDILQYRESRKYRSGGDNDLPAVA